MRLKTLRAYAVCLALTASTRVIGQTDRPAIGGPLTGPPVTDASFSAEATAILTPVLDGGRGAQTIDARYYRDTAGRVRVEQTLRGAGADRSGAGLRTVVLLAVGPRLDVYWLDVPARTARIGPRDLTALTVGGGMFAVPIGVFRYRLFYRSEADLNTPGRVVVDDQLLGRQSFEGLDATGRRVTVSVPGAQSGPVQVVDERWVSDELKLVVCLRSSDPRTGVLEYRLRNVRRREPPADLFIVPPGIIPVPVSPEEGGFAFEYGPLRTGQEPQVRQPR